MLSSLIFHSEVSVEDVRRAIQSVDPEAPTEMIDKYLERAFNIPSEQQESGTKIETTLLVKRLQSGSVRRLGAKPKWTDADELFMDSLFFTPFDLKMAVIF